MEWSCKVLMQKKIQNPDGFHAGRFLRNILQEGGHDVRWLAERTGRDIAFLDTLLDQANMDAELFVRIGLPMEPLFMQRVDEMIFGENPVIPQA